MAFDLIVRNARLADGDAARASVDIAIADGRIAAIAPGISGDGETVDAGGRLVSPGLVESHFHLDKARILDLDIFLVCDIADRIGWGGRVAIGHGSKYSCLPQVELESLGRRLADSGVAVTVLPATDLFNNGLHMEHSVMRGVADANALIGQGANCSISTNNVMNPFTPFGDCSLVRIANMYANVVQRGTEGDLSECFAMLTGRAAQILRRNDYGIAVGNPADLVVWNAKTPAEVIATVAQPVMAFKRGRRLFTREIATLLRP